MCVSVREVTELMYLAFLDAIHASSLARSACSCQWYASGMSLRVLHVGVFVNDVCKSKNNSNLKHLEILGNVRCLLSLLVELSFFLCVGNV
jgi:hypothetical protein